MLIQVADILALAERCAPTVAASTLLSIAQVESGLDPLAIGVNGTPRLVIKATSVADAVKQAGDLLKAGRNIDLGLAQINSRNLKAVGLSLAEAFDPCRNLSASAQILQNGYVRSEPDRVGSQAALRQALSYYNTGHPRRGFDNGYVAKVSAAAGVAALRVSPASPAPAEPQRSGWDVFGHITSTSFVIHPPLVSGAAR